MWRMARQRENPLSSHYLYRGSTGRLLAVIYENIDRGLDYTGLLLLSNMFNFQEENIH